MGVFASLNPFSIGDLIERPLARLELTDRTVRCTLLRKQKLMHAGWLAQRLQIPDLKERVKAGEQVTVFEFPRDGYQIKWPKLSTGTLFEISEPSSPPWILSFGMPRDYERRSWLVAYDFLMANERRQWREALSPTARELPRTGDS
ncbi:hypothetical protein [Mycobacterium sp.]|uniref:hypothetical protein n=1 Tax=Mycobacterium sp. TaxID=1785 RepID=UPI002C1D9ABF|nr:hypothetical protein [Mycobacterium sp.]HTQ21127.1 hypothetical protein [Mycobacterium sp.]